MIPAKNSNSKVKNSKKSATRWREEEEEAEEEWNWSSPMMTSSMIAKFDSTTDGLSKSEEAWIYSKVGVKNLVQELVGMVESNLYTQLLCSLVIAAPDGKLCLGQYRMELRKTHSTTVDVFHKDYTKLK